MAHFFKSAGRWRWVLVEMIRWLRPKKSSRVSRFFLFSRVMILTSLLVFFQNCGNTLNQQCAGSSDSECSDFSKSSNTNSQGGRNTNSSANSRNGSVGGSSSFGSSGSTNSRTGSSTSGGTVGGVKPGSGGGSSGGGPGTVGGGGGNNGGGSNPGGGLPIVPTPNPGGGNNGGGNTGNPSLPALPLRVVKQPESGINYENSTLRLAVVAEGGTPPYYYQWYLNDEIFRGSFNVTSSEIYINLGNYMNWRNAGTFKVLIKDSAGHSVFSSNVPVTISEVVNHCSDQIYYHLIEDRPEVLPNLKAPDSPVSDRIVNAKEFFITPLGTKYLIPLNFTPFSLPGVSNSSYNPIGSFMNMSEIRKAGWRMPAANHGSKVRVLCTPAQASTPSNWLKDFNEFPNNPKPFGWDWSSNYFPYVQHCSLSPAECARQNSTYVLRGSLEFECHNNKYKYVSGSCYWELDPNVVPPEPIERPGGH